MFQNLNQTQTIAKHCKFTEYRLLEAQDRGTQCFQYNVGFQKVLSPNSLAPTHLNRRQLYQDIVNAKSYEI